MSHTELVTGRIYTYRGEQLRFCFQKSDFVFKNSLGNRQELTAKMIDEVFNVHVQEEN